MKLQRSINESLLNQSLIKSSDALVRELAMAAKKVAIYGTLHPVAERALERLFAEFKETFKAKRFVNFNLESGRLHVMSIRQRETVFTEDVLRFLQSLEIRAVAFSDKMNHTDLATFVERLVKREKKEPHSQLVPEFLKGKNISTIDVNTERAHKFFEKNLKYRGDIDRDFTIRQVAFEELGGDLLRLSEIYDADSKTLESNAIDFNNEIVQYLIPEKMASFRSESIVTQLSRVFDDANKSGANSGLTGKPQKQLGRLLSLHPERSAIISALHVNYGGQIAALIRESVMPSVDEFTTDSFTEISDLDSLFFAIKDNDASSFAELFLRYYRTGRRGQAIEIADYLVKQLSNTQWHVRQKALHFLNECLKSIDPYSDKFILETLVVRLTQIIDSKSETLEHAELISAILEQGCRGRRFSIIVELVDSLARRKTVRDNVTVFDSLAIKSALMKLNRLEILNYLIDELALGNPATSKIIQRIFSAVGTEEVAQSLTKIISHPSRQLRQHVLKTLTELGRPALTVCSAILNNKLNFDRPDDRSDLPDYKWYLVRNAIYVLGSLKDSHAIESLRRRMNDRDIRVRREIILALEKIGGEEACDLFLLMAEDPSNDIRELALTKLGVIGKPESVPLVIDLLQRAPQMSVKCIHTIGQLGGELARTLLALLLQDEHKADDLTDGRVSKEDFKAAVVRALARLGDADSMESIHQYNKSLTGTQKILIKNTALDLALSEVIKPRK